MSVMEYNQCLAIVSASERLYMEFQGWHDYNTKPASDFSAELVSEIDIKQEFIQGVDESCFENSLSQFEDLPEIGNDILSNWEDLNEPSTSTSQKKERKPSPKWLSKALHKSKSVMSTTKGPKEVWTCFVCRKVTCRTHTGMRLHLVKFHEKELDCDANATPVDTPATPMSSMIKKEFSNTNNDTNGDEPLLTPSIVKLVKHPKDPNWIKSMADKSQVGSGDFYKCCICEKTTSASRFGMQLHITRIHCEKEDKTPQASRKRRFSSDEVNQDTSDDGADEIYPMTPSIMKPGEWPKHSRDPKWMDEMVHNSKNEDGAWTCCICHNVTSLTLKGIRIHIARMHCVSRSAEIGVTLYGNFWESESEDSDDYDSDFSNYAPNPVKTLGREKEIEIINEAINESRVSPIDSSDEAYNCCVCQSFKSKCYKGIRIHIVRMHLKEIKRRRHKKKVNEEDVKVKVEESDETLDESENSHDDETDDAEKETKLTNFEKKQLGCKIRNCKVLDSNLDTSYACKECNLEYKNYPGIRYHILNKHFENLDGPSEEPAHEAIKIEGIRGKFLSASEMEEADQKWVKECIQKSRQIETAKSKWKCWLCYKSYSLYGMIRYHIVTVHLPHWKLGSDAYNDHVEQYNKAIANLSAQSKTVYKASSNKPSKDQNSSDELVQGKFVKASEMTPGEKLWLRTSMKRSRNGHGWACWMCNKEYAHNPTMRYHLLVRHLPYWKLGEAKFIAHVESCGSQSAETIKKLRFKKRDQNRRCISCDLQFLSGVEHSAHIKMHDQMERIVLQMECPRCDFCSMAFKDKDDLQQHLNHHRLHEVPKLIPSEGILINNTGSLLPHAEDGSWDYQCGHCGKKYETEVDIQRHICLHHMNPFICPFDQREFNVAQKLIAHFHSSHMDVLGTNAKCKHCDAEFASNTEKLHHDKICEKIPLE